MTQYRALIFGISGQDGAYLARLLLDKGYDVHGTSRDSGMQSFSNLNALGIRNRVFVHSVAPKDFGNVLGVIEKTAPNEIYNLCGQSSVGLSFEQPVETMESVVIGTLNILESIRRLRGNIRFYNAGSSECYGDTGDGAATESSPFRPQSPYAVAKAASVWETSNYRQAYDLFACSGILFNHESPLRPERFVTRKIVRAAQRIASGSDEILRLGNIEIKRDWGWAPEYVEAMWRMLQQSIPEDYVIATGVTSSLRQFVEDVFQGFGLDWKKHVSVDHSLYRPSDILVSRGNAAKAARQLGWKAQTFMPDLVTRLIKEERP